MNLEWKDQLAVLIWSVVKLDEMIPHPDKAEMIEPSGIRLGLRLAQRKSHEVVNGFLANLPISASNSEWSELLVTCMRSLSPVPWVSNIA